MAAEDGATLGEEASEEFPQPAAASASVAANSGMSRLNMFVSLYGRKAQAFRHNQRDGSRNNA